MKVPELHSGIVIFLLFFGIGFLDALQSRNWFLTGFWLTVLTMFFVLDGRSKKSKIV